MIELLIVIGISAILLPALLVGLLASREGKASQSQRSEAIAILGETIEAVRSVREKGWTAFAVNGTFHPQISGSSWILITGSVTLGGFTRQIVISNLNRNSSGTIVSSGGTPDPSSKKVVVTISWGLPYTSSVTNTLYMTRYLDNNSFTQTTEAEFNAGTKVGTAVTNTLGGEVVLGAGGFGNWCSPNLSISALDLPKNGVANALTAIEGKAFAGTGDNSSGVSFANINISNTNPPIANIAGTFDGYKTNGVFGEKNYAYLATDNHSKEVIIIDLNNIVGGKYQEVGFFNIPGNRNAKSVYVAANIGYVTDDANHLYSFDLSSKSGSRPQLGSLTTDGMGTGIVVVGSYLYVSLYSGVNELQIINVSNPANMSVVGWNNPNGREGIALYVNPTGTRTYLVTNQSSDPNQYEFYIIDTSSKTGPREVLGKYDTNGMDPKGISVVTGNKAILVGTGGQEYQVIDISNELNPTKCGGLDIDSGINGVSSVVEEDGDAYSYIITGDAASEFKIIAGGPGGQYAPSGEFISSTFDAGYNTAFNRFDVSVNRPATANIKFQIALSNAISGSCTGASFTFVGPDATSATFFEIPVTSGTQLFSFTVPQSINPGRCFEYKAYLSTSDSTSTPIFYDFTMNYSP